MPNALSNKSGQQNPEKISPMTTLEVKCSAGCEDSGEESLTTTNDKVLH